MTIRMTRECTEGETNMKIANIETSRLILRGFTKDDALCT